jgi:integrase
MIGGVLKRRRVTHMLGPITTRGKLPPADIVTEAEKHMATINNDSIPVEQIVRLGEFVETIFLPAVKKNAKPSTAREYQSVWDLHLRALVSRERINLRDFRTAHVQRWLDLIGEGELSRNSLKRIKSMISGCFAEAKRLGYFNGENPARDTKVNPHAADPVSTSAYTLEEIQDILARLPEPSATCFAVAAYSGLRRGEVEALKWEDYHDGALHVHASRWNGQTVAPKTEMSGSPVPVIRPLARVLELHRLRNGDTRKDGCSRLATESQFR